MKGSSERPIPKKVLWANASCLLDTSSGAAMAIREMLRQLAFRGCEITILGATTFDAESGILRLKDHWQDMKTKTGQFIDVNDGPLVHRLLITASTHRHEMTAREEMTWHGAYLSALNLTKPDLMFYFGGFTLDLLAADDAQHHGTPVMAYLANGNYTGTRWCRDVDVIITNSQATADMYARKEGYAAIPVGPFIEPERVVAATHSRERLLFVNPSLEKGAGVVILLALLLESRRPDIVIEVVESRGNWSDLVRLVTGLLGNERSLLNNVVLTPNTDDMRPVYGRARLLLAPSLWWEGMGRVLVEAMMNGIPAVITERGGMPEMVQDAGIRLQLPSDMFEPPYSRLPSPNSMQPLMDTILRLYDEPVLYNAYVQRSLKVAQTRYRLKDSVDRLVKAINTVFR
jgi:glycosyltransferase involved in cell wall biosynthesis